MPNPYDSTEVRAAGDSCAWCSRKTKGTISIMKKGSKRLPYKVPCCGECKTRLESNAERDKRR